MLGWCLAYIYASVTFGAFLAALGYRHRVWSRKDASRSIVAVDSRRSALTWR